MNKREFFIYLRKKLRRFGDNNAEDAVAYYEEIISEKVRDGMSETEAVASLGDPAKIVAETAVEMVTDNKVKNPSRGVSLVLGMIALSPVLFPIAIAISIIYIVLFALWVGLTVGFGAGAISSIWIGIVSVTQAANTGSWLITLGISLIVAAVFAFICFATAKIGLSFMNIITVKLFRKLKDMSNKRSKVS